MLYLVPKSSVVPAQAARTEAKAASLVDGYLPVDQKTLVSNKRPSDLRLLRLLQLYSPRSSICTVCIEYSCVLTSEVSVRSRMVSHTCGTDWVFLSLTQGRENIADSCADIDEAECYRCADSVRERHRRKD